MLARQPGYLGRYPIESHVAIRSQDSNPLRVARTVGIRCRIVCGAPCDH